MNNGVRQAYPMVKGGARQGGMSAPWQVRRLARMRSDMLFRLRRCTKTGFSAARFHALAVFVQEKGWAASEKGETCGPKGGEERCFSIAICYGEQTSGGKGMSRLQGLLYRPMLKRACPGSGFGVMRS